MATLAHNLDVRRAACKRDFPGVEVGWIGNAAHRAECSDHNPDARGIVHAIDVMLPVGPGATAVVDWSLAAPEDLEYVIHNDRIYRRSHNFANESYRAVDPGRTDRHTNHVHISGRHGTVGRNAATCTGYNTTAEAITPAGSPLEDIVTPEDIRAIATAVVNKLRADPAFIDMTFRVRAIAMLEDTIASGTDAGDPVAITAAIKAIPTTAAPAGTSIDTQAVLTKLDDLTTRIESAGAALAAVKE